MAPRILLYLPIIFLVVYGVVVGLVVRRSYRPWRAPAIQDDPQGWLRSWFPRLIAAQVLLMVGALVTSLLLFFIVGLARSVEARYSWLGLGIGLGIIALLFAGVDAAIVAGVRAMQRRTRQLPDEGPFSLVD